MDEFDTPIKIFDEYIEKLLNGYTITISSYEYNDFLRYVKAKGFGRDFKYLEKISRDMDDIMLPPAYELTLLDREK